MYLNKKQMCVNNMCKYTIFVTESLMTFKFKQNIPVKWDINYWNLHRNGRANDFNLIVRLILKKLVRTLTVTIKLSPKPNVIVFCHNQ